MESLCILKLRTERHTYYITKDRKYLLNNYDKPIKTVFQFVSHSIDLCFYYGLPDGLRSFIRLFLYNFLMHPSFPTELIPFLVREKEENKSPFLHFSSPEPFNVISRKTRQRIRIRRFPFQTSEKDIVCRGHTGMQLLNDTKKHGHPTGGRICFQTRSPLYGIEACVRAIPRLVQILDDDQEVGFPPL